MIAYRELRLLELDILKKLNSGDRQRLLDIQDLIRVDVDQLYGIEIEEWPARIAEVAMWLMDHQMNLRFSEEFGQYFVRLPLRKSPHIHNENALAANWKSVLSPSECSYILGNPPFVGSKYQSTDQRKELATVFGKEQGVGTLDYVTAWYRKAADFIQGTDVRCAFVSTNSISQGEQVAVLWRELFPQGVKINFAHRTFAWQSEARGAAHVHVVIIGFSLIDSQKKRIFDYEDIKGDPAEVSAKNINPYLVNANNVLVSNRSKPLSNVPSIGIGNKPVDGGNYLFTELEKQEFIREEPASEKYFRRWFGSREFLNNAPRWCLWVGDCSPTELRSMPQVMKRVEKVKAFRQASKSRPTQAIANTPTRFHVECFPESSYLLIPKVSSERRDYIPMGFMSPDDLCSDLVFAMKEGTIFHFGVMSSSMHMAWVRAICGRLKSDYRYSAKLVYNNFPWPLDVNDRQQAAVEKAAQDILDARAEFPDSSLADLYDPLTTPVSLTKAQRVLDKTVDLCYRPQPFPHERNRVEHLFELYEQLTAPIVNKPKKSRKK